MEFGIGERGWLCPRAWACPCQLLLGDSITWVLPGSPGSCQCHPDPARVTQIPPGSPRSCWGTAHLGPVRVTRGLSGSPRSHKGHWDSSRVTLVLSGSLGFLQGHPGPVRVTQVPACLSGFSAWISSVGNSPLGTKRPQVKFCPCWSLTGL